MKKKSKRFSEIGTFLEQHLQTRPKRLRVMSEYFEKEIYSYLD